MARRYEFHKRRRNFQNIETQFGSLPYPKIMSLTTLALTAAYSGRTRHLAPSAGWRASCFAR